MTFSRTRGALVALLATGMLAAGCGGGNPLSKSGGQGQSKAPSGTVVVGSTDFPEQLLLADMYARTSGHTASRCRRS
jgi:osmoprotectant transport system substrate-binding protein